MKHTLGQWSIVTGQNHCFVFDPAQRLRGESGWRKKTERRDEIGRQVYDAVFRLQDFQWASGADCTELIAKASMKYSEPSAVAAQMAAMSDLFSSFKGTWTQRHIPTIEARPTTSKITMA